MGIFGWFGNLFNRLIRIAKRFIEDAINSLALLAIGELKDFAVDTIKMLAGTNLTNEEKRSEAFIKIKTEAIKRGINVRDSIVNILIELAVQYFKRVNEE